MIRKRFYSLLVIIHLLCLTIGCRTDETSILTGPSSKNLKDSKEIIFYLKDGLTQNQLAYFSTQVNRINFRTNQDGKLNIFVPYETKMLLISAFPYKTRSYQILNTFKKIDTLFLSLSNNYAQYQNQLLKALAKDYQFMTVIDWYWNILEFTDKKLIIMRHDIDADIASARAFGLIESLSGIRSSFYFRWTTADKSTISYLRDQGHEIGLHYETLAMYFARCSILYKTVITEETMDFCRVLLKNEIKLFEDRFGNISSTCSHGHYINELYLKTLIY